MNRSFSCEIALYGVVLLLILSLTRNANKNGVKKERRDFSYFTAEATATESMKQNGEREPVENGKTRANRSSRSYRRDKLV